ncbi:MAG: hypothetical protein LWW85_06310 [Marinilabiliales bacterium]|nr:hypothetical protein [Marinilabiliales bacterium]
MKKRVGHLPISGGFIAFLMILQFLACRGLDEATDFSDSLENNGAAAVNHLGFSHSTGKNCMNCHKFKVAGSLYKRDLLTVYPGAVVRLTTQSGGQGTEMGSFTVDNSGNIHSDKNIAFGSGLYVSVTGTSGMTDYMTTPIVTGACNSCHGTSVARAWAE